jgi:hypothetical protein
MHPVVTSQSPPLPADRHRRFAITCPFHTDHRWRDLRDNRPDEWADAVEFDRAIRHGNAGARNGVELRGTAYLHRSCVPLDQVDLSTPEERGQLNLFDGFAAECEGMCGV